MAAPVFTETLEMSITHPDFLRLFARLYQPGAYTVTGNRIEVAEGARRLQIALGAETRRTIGPTLSFPVTMVTMTFFGHTLEEQAAFLKRFHLTFQRGGG